MIKNINSGIMYFLGVRLPHASYGGAQHGKNTQTGDRKMLKQKPNRYLLAAAGLGISLAMAMPVHARYYSASDCAYRAERAAGNTYGAVGGAVTGAVGGATVGAIVSRNSRRGKHLSTCLRRLHGRSFTLNRNAIQNSQSRRYYPCLFHLKTS